MAETRPNRPTTPSGQSRPSTTRRSRPIGSREPSEAPRRRPSVARARTLRRNPRVAARAYHGAAANRLRRYRQASTLAVAFAALLLLLSGTPVPVEGQENQPAATQTQEAQTPIPADASETPETADTIDEATGTVRDLAYTFYTYLPRLILALVVGGVAWLLTRLARLVLERTLGAWERTAAIVALARIVILVVMGVAVLSILAGDARAVVGSVGLLGIAASWALQTPIESFTGWLLNSFRAYYRVGDRIAVGDVFGDVYRIDVLTTTVWEAGGPGKPVSAAQSTGALITFPNWEVLRSNVVNYSRDFPYVWDEVTIGVANESDLAYCATVLEDTARRVLGEQMEEAAARYEELLRAERLMFDVDVVPRVYLSLADSWTQCTIRYLVPVRMRRHWSSELLLAISREMEQPAHRNRMLSVYPRTEVQLREKWRPEK